jgi:hypothetical protein
MNDAITKIGLIVKLRLFLKSYSQFILFKKSMICHCYLVIFVTHFNQLYVLTSVYFKICPVGAAVRIVIAKGLFTIER